MEKGFFVISLDFELFWGVADFADAAEWKSRIMNVYEVVPRLLDLFDKYEIHVTWATVGGMLANNMEEYCSYLKDDKDPQILGLISKIKTDSLLDEKMLFAPNLVAQIVCHKHQEIGTHTFSHYYCKQENSSEQTLLNDIKSCDEIFREKGYNIPQSLVFPRNQVAKEYIDKLPDSVIAYRGLEKGLVTKLKTSNRKIGTLLWYIDHYIPIRAPRSYKIDNCDRVALINIPQSRFFKAYKDKYKRFEKLKLRRYKQEMLYAAKNNQVYHLCWHPHNLSSNIDINFSQIEEILMYFSFLKEKYDMRSVNMKELSELIRNGGE